MRHRETRKRCPRYASESQDTVIDAGEFTEIPRKRRRTSGDPEEPLTRTGRTAQEELERAKKLLNDGLKCDVDENDMRIRRLKIKVCAPGQLCAICG
ncbi:MAG: hypothetical protein ACLTBV_13820 [Enterocloster bolteae]